MTPNKVRTSIAAVGTISVVSATVLTGVASAVGPSAAGGRISTPTSAASARMQGAATGDGPATNADCQRAADSINSLRDLASIEGGRNAKIDQAQANQVMNAAENAGCFWID
jgi:negative regulator of sigma E activity